MATVYEIKIKTVSAFCSYSKEQVAGIFEEFLKEYKNKYTKLGFESTEIDVKIK